MIYLLFYVIIDRLFLIESTLRLWRAGFPLGVAYDYSINR